MASTFTSHSKSSRTEKQMLSVKTSDPTSHGMSMTRQTSMSLPVSPISMTGATGLLNSKNLDEKLVVATLATFDSGSATNLIKQDLKLIIQSRRKAEGKDELKVEFKKPVKDELTSEELVKKARRRELNRLAARRSREKGQKRKDQLVEVIRKLQNQNSELMSHLSSLTEQRNGIIDKLRDHMKQCSDYAATQSAAVGLSNRVLQLLGLPSSSSSSPTSTPASSGFSEVIYSVQSSVSQVKEEPGTPYSFSCPNSPLIVGISGTPLQHKETHSVKDPFSTTIVKLENHTSFAVSKEEAALKESSCDSPKTSDVVKSVTFMKPSRLLTQNPRTTLERSLSLPSSVPETGSSQDFHFPKNCSSVYPNQAALQSSSSGDAPLDLVVRRKRTGDRSPTPSSLDAWTIPGYTRKIQSPPIRRWSVDESSSSAQPLNLSRKNSSGSSSSGFSQTELSGSTQGSSFSTGSSYSSSYS